MGRGTSQVGCETSQVGQGYWDKAFGTCQEMRDKASSTCLMEHVKWDKESGIWDRIQSRNRKIGC